MMPLQLRDLFDELKPADTATLASHRVHAAATAIRAERRFDLLKGCMPDTDPDKDRKELHEDFVQALAILSNAVVDKQSVESIQQSCEQLATRIGTDGTSRFLHAFQKLGVGLNANLDAAPTAPATDGQQGVESPISETMSTPAELAKEAFNAASALHSMLDDSNLDLRELPYDELCEMGTSIENAENHAREFGEAVRQEIDRREREA